MLEIQSGIFPGNAAHCPPSQHSLLQPSVAFLSSHHFWDAAFYFITLSLWTPPDWQFLGHTLHLLTSRFRRKMVCKVSLSDCLTHNYTGFAVWGTDLFPILSDYSELVWSSNAPVGWAEGLVTAGRSCRREVVQQRRFWANQWMLPLMGSQFHGPTGKGQREESSARLQEVGHFCVP